jgi:hypothetical protein
VFDSISGWGNRANRLTAHISLISSDPQHFANHHVAKDEHAESQEPSKVTTRLSDMQTAASQGKKSCLSFLTISVTKRTPRAAIVSAVAFIANTMPPAHQHKLPLHTDKTSSPPDPLIRNGSPSMSPLRHTRRFRSSICSSFISTSRNHTAHPSTTTTPSPFPYGKTKSPKSLFLYPPKPPPFYLF